MGRFKYTPGMLIFLRAGYKTMRVPELTSVFNSKFGHDKTRVAVKSVLTSNNFTSGRGPGFAKGERITLLSQEQIDFVKTEYVEMSREELLAALNKQFSLSLKLEQLIAFLKNHKIRSGRNSGYKKGNVPWNKGKAGTGVCKSNSGSFKKGNRPPNYKAIGHERVCKKDGYVLVKVAEKNPWKSSQSGWWRHKHVVEWEKVHGSVPDGFCVRFNDGDKANLEIENLTLVSLGENARLNQMGYNGLPDEIKPAVMAVAKIDQKISERT